MGCVPLGSGNRVAVILARSVSEVKRDSGGDGRAARLSNGERGFLYWRIDELDENKFPFLQQSILTDDGILVVRDGATRRQLMKEAKLLTELTSPRVRLDDERKRLEKELDEMPDGPEFNAKNARLQELEQ